MAKVELRRHETQRQLIKRYRAKVSQKLRTVRRKRRSVSKRERWRMQKKKAIRRRKKLIK